MARLAILSRLSGRHTAPMLERRRLVPAVLLGASALVAGVFGVLVLMQVLPGFTRLESAVVLLLAAIVMALLALGVASGQVRFRGADDAAMLAAGWEGLPAATLLVRRDGRPVLANGAYEELLRRAGRRRLVSVEHLFAGLPEVAAHIYRMQQRLKGGRVVSELLRIPASFGAQDDAGEQQVMWLRVSVRLVESEGALFELWQLADETTRHAEQEALLRRLLESEQALDHLPVGIVVADGEGYVQHVNATLAAWTGLDEQRRHAAGLQLTDILPAELVEQLSVNTRAAPGGVALVEQPATLHGNGGRARPVMVLHRVETDAAGRRAMSQTVLVPRLQGADTGRELLQRFIATIPIGLALVDDDGKVRFINAALARTVENRLRVGDEASALVAPQDAGKLRAALRAVLEGQRERMQLDVYLFEPDSTRAQITVAASPGGGAVMFVIDTTLRQTLMEQIEHGQIMQQIGMMASQLAHDFNNLLTPIMGSADILLQRMRVTDPNYELVHNIKSRSWDAARIVEQLLAFARRQTMQPEVIAINDWLMREARLLRTMLKSRNVELRTEYGTGIWPIRVDPRKLSRVVVNLVRNAEDAMAEKGGQITIRTRNVAADEIRGRLAEVMAVGDYVLIEVEDTGPGIPEDIREKIFDPFFSTKPMGKGTGLGLATVYGIVKQSGGYVFCDSEPGQGTTFRIYLPRHVETEEERRRRREEAEARERRSKLDLTGSGVILLAEDEDTVRDFAVQALRMRGYTVLAAPSAELALDMMEERLAAGGSVDLIVSDVVMPGMDGPTMVRKLREMGVNAPVVFMSGHAEDAFARNLDEDMTFVFLAKPFDLRTIAEAAKEALSGGGGRRGASDVENAT